MKDYGIYVEEFVANGMMIREIATKYNVSRHLVERSISKYYGSGKYKTISAIKPCSKQQLINKYTNLTNLKEIYEQEYRRG